MNSSQRAWVRQRSGRRLNLLDPDPYAWTDEDLSVGLSRTYRWGGHSIWPLPYSVAQHSLLVLALYEQNVDARLSDQQRTRELLHDADEALIGGFDPISPLKPFLGPSFFKLVTKLQKAVFTRYGLAEWNDQEHRSHKIVDTLAAASEAVHIAGWAPREVKELLGIDLEPLIDDPLAVIYGCRPWEPWAPDIAAKKFLKELRGEGRAVLSATSTLPYPVLPLRSSELDFTLPQQPDHGLECALECRWCYEEPTTCVGRKEAA